VDDENDEDEEDEDEDKEEEEEEEKERSGYEGDKEKKKICPEKMFVKNFSRFYEEIGDYFPVFLRLRELLKLGTILLILREIYKNIESVKKNIVIDTEPIRSVLRELRTTIEYPLNTNSKVNEIFNQVLRDNLIYNEYRVIPNEIDRVKSEIRRRLREAEETEFETVAHDLSEYLEITYCNNLYQHVSNWIQHQRESNLVNYLENQVKEKKIKKLSKFGENLKRWGVKVEGNEEVKLSNSGNECVWVPAAFSKGEKCKAYGGVCLIPNLVSASPQSSGQGGGGGRRGGDGRGGSRDRGGHFGNRKG
jgi:hypothetical protein